MMYRRGESVSRQLHSMDVQDTRSRGYISPEMASPSGSSSPYTPNFYSADQRQTTSTYSNELALSGKMNEMMSMLSGTQQMLMSQQAATQRLEEKVGKLAEDVCGLQRELEGIKSSSSSTTESTTKSNRVKVPTDLSVSH